MTKKEFKQVVQESIAEIVNNKDFMKFFTTKLIENVVKDKNFINEIKKNDHKIKVIKEDIGQINDKDNDEDILDYYRVKNNENDNFSY